MLEQLLVWGLAMTAVTAWNYIRRNNRSRVMVWRKAAMACGLRRIEETAGSSVSRLRFVAQAGGRPVRFEDSGAEVIHTRIIIPFLGPPGFASVAIRREQVKPKGAREIEVGDDSFDRAFYIVGPARLVHGLLAAEMRRLMLRLNHAATQVEVVTGELRVDVLDEKVEDVLPLVLDAGRQIALPMDVVQRLAENAREDPEAGVRINNLLVLTRELPGDPRTAEALRTACSDASGLVRLRAAQGLGAEGRRILIEVAESTTDDAASAEAVLIVSRELPFERMRAILVQALRRRLLQTARACLEVFGSGGDAAVETLVKVMEREKGELAAAAAVTLGATGSAAAEPPLILALQHDQKDVLVAAANALSRVGSAAAVLPLKEAAGRSSRDPEILRATRQAIARIQLRLPGASPGQLSLAGAEAGQLSFAQGEAGHLSLATEAAGQLSLSQAEPGQLSVVGEEPAARPV